MELDVGFASERFAVEEDGVFDDAACGCAAEGRAVGGMDVEVDVAGELVFPGDFGFISVSG